MNRNCEHAVFTLEQKKFTEDDDNFYFEGYLSVFNNVDHGGDRVIPGAFKKALIELEGKGDAKLPVFWNHDDDSPVGVFTELAEDEQGLFVKGRLPLADDFVRGRIVPQMKTGSIAEMSMGFSTITHKSVGNVRELHEVKLWEGSLTSIAMNPKAKVTDFKSAVPYQDYPIAPNWMEWDPDGAIRRIKNRVGATDAPNPAYRRAFLWFDSESPDSFDAYKMPIVDVWDTELRIVPRAVFHAAALMVGARGGIDIPESDRDAVKANIDRYYAKLGMESPFEEGSFRVDDVGALSERELETLMKSGVSFSRGQAKKVVSAIKSVQEPSIARQIKAMQEELESKRK
ncbi:HK97 family phage prohead protease [Lysobacter sp. GCM10012299]|uniref:HK97 family phage prohead protease n=1 Tax=Lysobacter sp. GCM10012299 TaxID=3317333 RepID=UPI003617B14E